MSLMTKKIKLICVVVFMIVLLVIVNIGVSNLLKSIYYNPTETSSTNNFKNFDLDMYALYELNSPGYESLLTIISDEGYGSYDMILTEYNTFKSKKEKNSIELKRNNLIGIYDQMFKNELVNLDRSNTMNKSNYNLMSKELKKENNYASVYITYKDPISLDEALENIDLNDNLIFKWMSFKHSKKYEHILLGFTPYKFSNVSFGESPDSTIYPMFYLNEAFRNTTKDSLTEEEILSYNHKLHVKSLLTYLLNRKQFLNIFNLNSNNGDLYASALEYIDNEGLIIIGTLIYGETSDIINFIENEHIYKIQILDVQVSKYSQ